MNDDLANGASKWQSISSRLPLNLSIILAAVILGISIIFTSLINKGSLASSFQRWFLARDLTSQFAGQLQSQLGDKSFLQLETARKCRNVVIDDYDLSADERTIDIKFHVNWTGNTTTWTGCSLHKTNDSQYESDNFDLGIRPPPNPTFHVLTK